MDQDQALFSEPMADFETPARRPRFEDLLNASVEGTDQGGEVPAEALRFPDDQQLDHTYLSQDNLEAFDVASESGIPPCFTGCEALG